MKSSYLLIILIAAPSIIISMESSNEHMLRAKLSKLQARHQAIITLLARAPHLKKNQRIFENSGDMIKTFPAWKKENPGRSFSDYTSFLHVESTLADTLPIYERQKATLEKEIGEIQGTLDPISRSTEKKRVKKTNGKPSRI